MAESVIDPFQIVEIAIGDNADFAIAPCPGQGCGQSLFESAPVEKAGHRIGAGQVFQLGDPLALVGHLLLGFGGVFQRALKQGLFAPAVFLGKIAQKLFGQCADPRHKARQRLAAVGRQIVDEIHGNCSSHDRYPSFCAGFSGYTCLILYARSVPDIKHLISISYCVAVEAVSAVPANISRHRYSRPCFSRVSRHAILDRVATVLNRERETRHGLCGLNPGYC